MKDEIAAELTHVYRFALRLTRGNRHIAEDIAHDAMVKALSNSHQCRNPQALRAWIFRITANTWNDWVRAKQSRLSLVPGDVAEQEDRTKPVQEFIELRESVDKTMAAMDQLPQRQRSVLYLTACEQLSAHEVSEVLQISVGAVKASLCVARAKMRLNLSSEESTETNRGEKMAP